MCHIFPTHRAEGMTAIKIKTARFSQKLKLLVHVFECFTVNEQNKSNLLFFFLNTTRTRKYHLNTFRTKSVFFSTCFLHCECGQGACASNTRIALLNAAPSEVSMSTMYILIYTYTARYGHYERFVCLVTIIIVHPH